MQYVSEYFGIPFMANWDEVHSTTAVGSALDVIQTQEQADSPADSTPLENPEQQQPIATADGATNQPPLVSHRTAGVFAKSNSAVVIDAIPDSAIALHTDSRADEVNQASKLAEIDDFQPLSPEEPISPPSNEVATNDLDAALAEMIHQESAFSTEPVEPLSTEPADDFPVDQPNPSATLSGRDSHAAHEVIHNTDASSEKAAESPAAASNTNTQEATLAASNSGLAAWEAFYQSLVTANKKQKIEIANENSPYAVFVPDGDKPGIKFFDQTGKEEPLKGAPAEQLERHFAGHGIGDVFATRLPTGKNLEKDFSTKEGNPSAVQPNGDAKSQPAHLVVAPSATESEIGYREAAEPRFAATTPPHAFHGPSAALASALVGTAALPFNLMAALNDKVRDFRLTKQLPADNVGLGQPQNHNVEIIPQAASITTPISEVTPALHERLSEKLKDYTASIDRFHETPEMEEVSKALDKYSPENRNKALKDDPTVAKLVHQAVTANPELVKTIHSQANDVETIAEELDETVFGKLQKEQAKQLQDALGHAQEKTKALPFHDAFDSLKDKFSSAMSSLFEKLGAFISKFTQSNRADASASAELS